MPAATPLDTFRDSLPHFAEDNARLTAMIVALGAEVFALKVEAALLRRLVAADPALADRLAALRDGQEFRAWMAAEERAFAANLLDPLGLAARGGGHGGD